MFIKKKIKNIPEDIIADFEKAERLIKKYKEESPYDILFHIANERGLKQQPKDDRQKRTSQNEESFGRRKPIVEEPGESVVNRKFRIGSQRRQDIQNSFDSDIKRTNRNTKGVSNYNSKKGIFSRFRKK